MKATFPNTITVKRPFIQNIKNFELYWLTGFTNEKNYLRIKLISQSNSLGIQIQLKFKFIQHSKNELLMNNLVNSFKCGKIYKYRKTVNFVITKYNDLNEKIIPFFDKYKIVGVKFEDFSYFKQVLEIMINKDHLTPEGLKKN